MSLKTTILDASKISMKSGDKPRVKALRLILADIQRYEVDNKTVASDKTIIDILCKMIKQRNDALKQYQTANRTDLAAQEEYEIKIIQEFLPEALSKEELETIISTAISKTQSQSIKDMGKVMSEIKPKIQGRADMSQVSQAIKLLLQPKS
jgi:uncharacterized protein